VSAKEDSENAPIAKNGIEWALIAGSIVTMVLVAVWFQLDVNRVFDVPKATALKVGGSTVFLIVLGWGFFGGGFAYRSLKLFVAPVAALSLVVIVSTLLSIDFTTSLFGVYERQFGLQGFLGCVGLFFATAVGFRSQRGALFGLAALAVGAGLMGSYALLQATGHDPYPFFAGKPSDKVYSFLGNATFAGNALALAFPISAVLAVYVVVKNGGRSKFDGGNNGIIGVVIGFVAYAFFQVGMGYFASGGVASESDRPASIYKLGVGLSIAFLAMAGGMGSLGPGFLKSADAKNRRFFDAVASGGLLAAALGIGIGIVCTQTRGAWVGTAAAFAGAFVFAPFLVAPEARKRILTISWGALAGVVLLFAIWVSSAESICGSNARCLRYAKTIRSIPAAFQTEKYIGKGQGTRPFLWRESPRVLFDHEKTLERLYDDRIELAAGIAKTPIEGVTFPKVAPLSEADRVSDTAWRTKLVYLFGIGIETYRFAFMSHKSKALETRDPMTNHDNPHNNYLYVLASFGILGLAAYLWLLFRLLGESLLRFMGRRGSGESEERIIAFGVLLSFFSYAFYSIGGFDSVACSVFLYFLLGTASAYLEPTTHDPAESLALGVRRHWAAFRKKSTEGLAPLAMPVRAVLVVPLALLLLYSVKSGFTIYRAEQAFVAYDKSVRTREAYVQSKLDGIKKAINLHPYESYYWQNLGNTYGEAARAMRAEAVQSQRQGQPPERAQDLIKKAEIYEAKAEASLYAALDHAWAPENVFISLFQMQYAARRYEQAERSLERGLVHSPHLGAVRANLAVLKLERGAAQEALADARWVIDVDYKSVIAVRTAGRAYMMLGDLRRARAFLDRAKQLSPKDPGVAKYLEDLAVAEAKAATATAARPG
jgi:tetratricopeptide (TPR) repeat protein